MASNKQLLTVDIKGADGLRLAMAAYGNPKAMNKALQTASFKAAAPVVQAAKSIAPVRTGRLKNAIRARRSRKGEPTAVATIRPGRKRDDMKGAYYRYIVTSGIPKRGIPARPFMAQALASVEAQSIKIFEETFEELVTNKLVSKRKGR